MPMINGRLTIPVPNSIMPAKRTKKIINRPKITEAMMSPKMIAQRDMGDDASLSNVFILVSQGAITGVIADTEKKSAIPNNPGIRKSKDASLLKENARNKKAGISNPCMITGPLI